MVFFIDIGNTRIKYCEKSSSAILAIEYYQINDLFCKLKQDKACRLLITAGRSPQAKEVLSTFQDFANKNNIIIELVKVRPEILPVNYADDSQFGEDRFLHLLAAREVFKKNFCVVSCGTAITLDFYTDKHIGGIITLGLGTAKQVLFDKTGLSNIEKPTSILGNDTATSIGAGIYFGYKNLIYGTIEQVEKKLNLSFMLSFTGGDAKVLCENNIIINELLFKGMKIYDNYRTKIHCRSR